MCGLTALPKSDRKSLVDPSSAVQRNHALTEGNTSGPKSQLCRQSFKIDDAARYKIRIDFKVKPIRASFSPLPIKMVPRKCPEYPDIELASMRRFDPTASGVV